MYYLISQCVYLSTCLLFTYTCTYVFILPYFIDAENYMMLLKNTELMDSDLLSLSAGHVTMSSREDGGKQCILISHHSIVKTI